MLQLCEEITPGTNKQGKMKAFLASLIFFERAPNPFFLYKKNHTKTQKRALLKQNISVRSCWTLKQTLTSLGIQPFVR